ncbi:hypothetical protein GEMRC1_013516 [Eukaryota sp. GEM-RC1]
MSCTRFCSAAAFFQERARASIVEDVAFLTKAAYWTSLFVRKFLHQFPELGSWATTHDFWVTAFDFMLKTNPRSRAQFQDKPNRHPEVFAAFWQTKSAWPYGVLAGQVDAQLVSARAKQLAQNHRQILTDGPVVWSTNWFHTMAQLRGCPVPKAYSKACVGTSSFPPSVRQWVGSNHQRLLEEFINCLGGPAAYSQWLEILSSRSLLLSSEKASFISTRGLRLLSYLEAIAPVLMKRNRLSPIASFLPGMITLSEQTLARYCRLNDTRALMISPYKKHHEKPSRYPTWAMSTNGLSVHVCFQPKVRLKRRRRTKAEMEVARDAGSIDDFRPREVNRKKKLKGKIPRRNWQEVPDDSWPQNPVDPFFVAIDPNHKNLCGWTAGVTDPDGPQHSGLLLNPKPEEWIPERTITQLSADVYLAQDFDQYLFEITATRENLGNQSIVDFHLSQGLVWERRRRKFDF